MQKHLSFFPFLNSYPNRQLLQRYLKYKFQQIDLKKEMQFHAPDLDKC